MTSFFSGMVSFLYPTLLAVAAPIVLGVLVIAYLRQGRSKRKKVATLYLLKMIESVPRARRKFLPPLRFFFELLLLAMLCLAAAGIYSTDASSRVVYIIDNSFSTSASLSKFDDAKTVLAKAKEAAAESLDGLASAAEVEVFVTSPQLRSITAGFVSSGRAADALASVEFAYASDRIDEAVEKLQRAHSDSEIRVYTDKKGISKVQPELGRVSVTTIERGALNNIAIGGITLANSTMSGTGRQLEAVVASFGDSPVTVEVELGGINVSASPVGVEAIDRRTLQLPAGGRVTVTFKDLPAGIEGFKVAATSKEYAGARDSDSNPHDNAAWIAGGRTRAEFLLVGDLNAALLGLSKLSGPAFDYMKPEKYEESSANGDLGAYRGFVFHRYIPRRFPPGNSIFVIPETTGALLTTAQVVSNVPVTRWHRSHDLLSYLDIANLTFKKLSPLELPNWGEVLINTSAGAAAYAGERDGHRIAVLGFELFPFEGRRSPLISVLTLNLFKWMTLHSLSSHHQTSAAIPISAELERAEYLFGSELYRRGNETPEGAIELFQPGLAIFTFGGRKEFFAVNFINDAESDLRTQQTFQYSSVSTPADSAKQNDSDLMEKLLWIAALLIVADLLNGLFPLRRPVGTVRASGSA
ncbi:MAG: BatA domain-containing protein [Deltaproteobacteria bacterium]|nr:BatA domain-containing protein [Deltaproteobacteria bacterium]